MDYKELIDKMINNEKRMSSKKKASLLYYLLKNKSKLSLTMTDIKEIAKDGIVIYLTAGTIAKISKNGRTDYEKNAYEKIMDFFKDYNAFVRTKKQI